MINIPVRRSGRVRLETLRGGVVVADTGFTDNLITDSGISAMNAPGNINPFGTLRVGSGTTPPAFSDTALVNQLASTATANFSTVIHDGWAVSTTATLFSVGAVVGSVGEVGFGSSSSSALTTRALIKDQTGDPVLVPVLADEQLRVTYEVRCRIPQSPVVTDMIIDGNTHTVTITPTRTDVVGVWSGVVSGNPGSAWVKDAMPGSLTPSSSGALSDRRGSWVVWGPSSGNAVGGVQSIEIAWTAGNGQIGLGGWNLAFNPPLPKDNTKTLRVELAAVSAR